MKRATLPRRLHMGCGECLTGRLPVPSRRPAVAPGQGHRQAPLKAGKDRR